MTFHKRKQERTRYFETYVKGWKLETCVACNGSGYYDNGNPNPPCGACEGTGKYRVKPKIIKTNYDEEKNTKTCK